MNKIIALSSVLLCAGLVLGFLATLSGVDIIPEISIPKVASVISGDADKVPVIKIIDDGKITFKELFENNFVVEEVWPISVSRNKNWWVSSGGYLISKNGTGSTIQGALEEANPWAKTYRTSNPRDTNGGKRPQNIFRLVLKKEMLDASQEFLAKINYYDPSDSDYRNESNGILLLNRYQDEDNLYYAGIRVDGKAVIKKKLKGNYTTLGESAVFSRADAYDRNNNSNFLPTGEWIGIKSSVTNIGENKVQIELFFRHPEKKNWEKVLSVIDDGVSYGPAITEAGFGGIRTDFMDAEFDEFVAKTY